MLNLFRSCRSVFQYHLVPFCISSPESFTCPHPHRHYLVQHCHFVGKDGFEDAESSKRPLIKMGQTKRMCVTSHDLRGGTGDVVRGSLNYGLWAKDGFYMFKRFKKKTKNPQNKKVCHRNKMWLARPKIFTIWPFSKVCHRTNLVAQWLRVPLPKLGAQVWSLVREVLHAVWHNQ